MLKLSLLQHYPPAQLLPDPDSEAERWPPALEQASRLLASLQAAAARRIEADERQLLLEAQYARVQALQPGLLALATDTEGSSATQARAAAQLAQQLLLAVHIAFKQLLVLRSQQAGRLLAGHPAIEPLVWTFASAWELASLHALTYTHLPADFWLDCHRLFLHALGQGWHSKRAKRHDASADLLYRQLLILGMSAANRLETRQIKLLLQLISEQARHINLVQLDQPLGASGGAVFQPEFDQPPRFMASLPPRSHGWWQLDISKLTSRLDSRLRDLQQAEVVSRPELQLLSRLQHEWGSPPQRRHERQPPKLQEKIELISQLAHCWQTAEQAYGKPALAGWELALPSADEAPAEALPPAQFSICNLSSSGMLLEGESAGHPLQAGGLVMLRRPGHEWQLGLIRWVSYATEGLHSQCGVELIGRTPEAVMVMPMAAHGQGVYSKALRLRRAGMLILPGRHYQPQRELLVVDAEQQRQMAATRLVVQASQYQLIEVRRVEREDE